MLMTPLLRHASSKSFSRRRQAPVAFRIWARGAARLASMACYDVHRVMPMVSGVPEVLTSTYLGVPDCSLE